MAIRFEKFSERARRVLTLSQEEAQSFNHPNIGHEHILLGIVLGNRMVWLPRSWSILASV
jgi:ATP-dependent Clp protease ATP-binding subunit ClpA